MNADLPDWLRGRLSRPLPDRASGARYEPSPPRGRHDDPPRPDARRAAVLMLIYPRDGAWHLPLTLRPEHLPLHAGQVSLPGGMVEPGETGREAALREFHEELGAAGHPIDVLAALSTIYVPASNFVVEPWVAATERRPDMHPHPAEVAELLEVPLDHLLAAEHFGAHRRAYRGQEYLAPHFAFGPHRIWGATCRMLGELVTLLQEYAREQNS
jgi:8-oxo-dGTP pyrophosphatase MutT (NUDIX family)